MSNRLNNRLSNLLSNRFDGFKHRHKVKKSEFKQQLPQLRAELLELQNTLRQAKFPVIVLFAGVDGAGKSEIVAQLNEWMDPRWLVNRAYTERSQEEQERPEFWRYWRDLPPKGQMGLFLSAWYSAPLLKRVKRHYDADGYTRELQRIQRFEQTLADDGALVIKFWMHLDKKQQKRQLKKLESDSKTAWQVSDTDWAHWALYDRFIDAADELLSATDSQSAPWQVVDGKDPYYRALHVARTIQDAIQNAIKGTNEETLAQAVTEPTELPVQSPAEAKMSDEEKTSDSEQNKLAVYQSASKDWLASIDNAQTLSKTAYNQQLIEAQAELNQLVRQAQARDISTLLVFEGWDAAGKGGAIRRIIQAMDPKYYQVVPIAAPTQEEHAQHYLWRFWRHLPRAGRVTIFDRSWYGRVLVERLEGFAKDNEWQRAYAEINEFEAELSEAGIMVCKFWLHIDKDEQLRRFEERAKIPHKAWKLTDEDWRNREKWDDYVEAVNDMVDLTHTDQAPWVLVPANDKLTARVKVVRAVSEQLRQRLATH